MCCVRHPPLLFATTNQGKLGELQRAAASYGIEVQGLESVAPEQQSSRPNPAEIGNTYEQNALLKARAYAVWAAQAVIADDTGLEIEALGSLPGVYTARYGVQRLLAELPQDVPVAAQFVCCLAYVEPTGRAVCVTSRLPGTFTAVRGAGAPEGVSLPFSRFFVPDGMRETLSELISKRPGYSSHRVLAFETLIRALR